MSRSLKIPTNYVPDLRQLNDIVIGVCNLKDREAVLIGCAVIDAMIELSIVDRISLTAEGRKEIFGTVGPLGSARSKLIFASGIGLISPLSKKALIAIQEVRNHFAHALVALDLNSGELVPFFADINANELYKEMEQDSGASEVDLTDTNYENQIIAVDDNGLVGAHVPEPRKNPDQRELFYDAFWVLWMRLFVNAGKHIGLPEVTPQASGT